MKNQLWNEPDSDLLGRCKKGDDEALAELLVSFTPLVRYIARKFAAVSSNDVEDLLQEGYISIINAVKGHEVARGKFSSYSFSCIRNRMISFLRRNRGKFAITGLSEEMADALTSTMDPDEEAFPDRLEQELFSGLTCLETKALDAFLEAGSISGAALILEWPRKRVDNALQRIRKKVIEKNNPDYGV